MMSASKSPSPTEVAVRQAPLTATESPGWSSEARAAPIRRRAPSSEASTASTRPSSSINPVNISLVLPSPLPQLRSDQHVLADLLEVRGQRPDPVGDPDGALALEDGASLGGADQNRSDEKPQLIDLARVEERSRQGRAPLDEQVLDLPAPELVQRCLEPRGLGPAGGHDHLRASPLQGVASRRSGLRGADHDQGRLVDRVDQRRAERQSRPRVEDHPRRLAR